MEKLANLENQKQEEIAESTEEVKTTNDTVWHVTPTTTIIKLRNGKFQVHHSLSLIVPARQTPPPLPAREKKKKLEEKDEDSPSVPETPPRQRSPKVPKRDKQKKLDEKNEDILLLSKEDTGIKSQNLKDKIIPSPRISPFVIYYKKKKKKTNIIKKIWNAIGFKTIKDLKKEKKKKKQEEYKRKQEEAFREIERRELEHQIQMDRIKAFLIKAGIYDEQ